MARKPLTEEQKEALRERLAAARAAKQEKKKQLDIVEEVEKVKAQEPAPKAPEQEVVPEDEPVTTINTESNTETLLNRALEAMALMAEQNARLQAGTQKVEVQGPQVKAGRLTGTLDRFSMSKDDYIDFTDRLSQDPTLSRFGFEHNFELVWKFEPVRYQTIDGVWMQEPKITIDLIRKIYDEETNELTNGRYKEFRIIIHEDPDAAIWVARQHGVAVPEDAEGETAFLNEMRFLQVRDWLRECFMPKKPVGNNNRKDMVINGKLVEYFEVNSENSQKLPFDKLGSKL